MRPKDLSEFSYGYALTESLVNSNSSKIKAAPYFPSLIEEGKKGGGYDVKISFSGCLLYLQFKLSDRMERRSAIETKMELLQPPFFRMPLRSSAKSNQHAMLIELEESGARVFYATPRFNTAKALDDAYLGRRVIADSCFFSPLGIGHLPDDKSHWVAFSEESLTSYFCSDAPRPLSATAVLDGTGFLDFLPEAASVDTGLDDIRKTSERMQEIILKELLYGPYRQEYPVDGFSGMSFKLVRGKLIEDGVLKEYGELDEEVNEVEKGFRRMQKDRSDAEQLAYLSRTFLGCEVIQIVRKP